MKDTLDPNVNVFDPEIDVNALGQALDSSWGRTTTPRTSQYSVKFSLTGGCLQASYAAIVNFASEREMIMMKRRYEEEARSVIESIAKNISKTYKEICGKSLKLKSRLHNDSVEVISNSSNNPKRTAYYRSKCLFDMVG
jgi:hypothetical protein